MDSTNRSSTQYRIDKIAYILLGIILFDCMALGGGSYIKIVGIDIRMVWFALFFLASLPAVFRNFRRLITNSYALGLLLWLAWLIFSTIRGFAAGNNTSRIISGLVGFASFGILPGCMAILTDKRRIVGLMKVAVVASVLLCVQTVVLLTMHNLDGEWLVRINNRFLAMELGSLSIVNQDIVRIFLRSHPLAVFGCGCAVYLAVKAENKKTFLLYAAGTAFTLFSLLVSFTRSVYLAILVAVVFLMGMYLWFLDKKQRKRLVGWLGTTVAVFLVVLLVFDMIFGAMFLSYGVYRSTGRNVGAAIQNRIPASMQVDLTPGPTEPEPTEPEETEPKETKPEETEPEETKAEETKPEETKPEETKPKKTETEEKEPVNVDKVSDDLRTKTRKELLKKIKENPLLGSGMGAVLKARKKLDGVNEYFYLDQAFKTGIIGIVLYMLPMLLLFINLLFRKRHMSKDSILICAVWLAGLLGIAAFSGYNPYLNGSNGILLYCGSIAVMSTLNDKQQVFKNKK